MVRNVRHLKHFHKILRSAFRQAVKWNLMEKNPAVDATVPKAKTQEREIWTAEMLMQALEACDNKTVRVLKTPKTDSSTRKVYIPKSVAQCLVELKAEQDEIKEALGN